MTVGIVNISSSVPGNRTQPPIAISGPCDSSLEVALRTAALCFLLLASLGGNLLVVGVVYRKLVPGSAINYFILNMAVSDMVIPFVLLPWRIANIFTCSRWLVDGAMGSLLCKLLPFMGDVSTAVSIFTMVAIAVDRFHCIMFPMRATLISVKASRRVIIAVWVLATALHSFYFYTFKVITRKRLSCITSWDSGVSNGLEFKIQFTAMFVVLIALLFSLLAVLYSCIIFALYRQKISLHLATDALRQRAAENRKVTYMLMTVVIAFCVLWIPHLMFGFTLFKPNVRVTRSFYFVATYLPLIYSALNPAIYYFFNEKYRKGFRELLSCRMSPPSSFVHCNLNATTNDTAARSQLTSRATMSSGPDTLHSSVVPDKRRSAETFGLLTDNGASTRDASV